MRLLRALLRFWRELAQKLTDSLIHLLVFLLAGCDGFRFDDRPAPHQFAGLVIPHIQHQRSRLDVADHRRSVHKSAAPAALPAQAIQPRVEVRVVRWVAVGFDCGDHEVRIGAAGMQIPLLQIAVQRNDDAIFHARDSRMHLLKHVGLVLQEIYRMVIICDDRLGKRRNSGEKSAEEGRCEQGQDRSHGASVETMVWQNPEM